MATVDIALVVDLERLVCEGSLSQRFALDLNSSDPSKYLPEC